MEDSGWKFTGEGGANFQEEREAGNFFNILSNLGLGTWVMWGANP